MLLLCCIYSSRNKKSDFSQRLVEIKLQFFSHQSSRTQLYLSTDCPYHKPPGGPWAPG